MRDPRRHENRCQQGQYKGDWRNKGAIVGVAAGHRASRQAAHVVAAIPGGVRNGRRPPVMMLGDGAVVSGTASHAASGPCGSGKWGIQEHDREQAQASGKDGSAILKVSSHGVR